MRSSVIYLGAFVAFLVARDVLYEVLLQEDPLVVSFVISVSVAAISAIVLVAQRRMGTFVKALVSPPILRRSLSLGLLASVIYVVTFGVIERVGAGLFNMIDWGLAPFFSLIFGWLYFRETPKPPLVTEINVNLRRPVKHARHILTLSNTI